ncbi:MAG: DUF368 domain-containing protein [Clostridia bacterium]|nr:DUF368 domain-containing protein [Clostridia bacterium]
MAKEKNEKIGGAVLRFFQGLILGGSGILPGVSGGVLCVVFGLYKPLMEVLAAPFKKIKEHWRMLIPVGFGALTGLLLLVHALGAVLENYKSFAECAFVGLIIGTLPALVRTAGKDKRTGGSYAAFLVSFTLVFSLLTYLKFVAKMSIEPSFFWFMIAGVIFGISIVMPGMSAYTVLEFFGLFSPLVLGAKSFDLGVLLPVVVGGAAALILLAKLINILYEKHFSIMSHIIIGIVVATTIPLIPTQFNGAVDIIIKLLLMAGGFVIALLFDFLGNRVKS